MADTTELPTVQDIETGGSGGRFSAVIPRWAGNSTAVTRTID